MSVWVFIAAGILGILTIAIVCRVVVLDSRLRK